MSKHTQISLDFGPEQQSPPPSPADIDPGSSDAEEKYMAAEGVGVRLKSYKRTTVSPQEDSSDPVRVVHGDLFDAPAATATGAEPTIPAAEAPAAAPLPRRPTSRKTAPAPKKGPSKRGRKSLKQITAEADLIEIPEDEELFSKQYYTMGEVSEMFRVNQSLLRFWETEFNILQPRKNKKGDRHFRPVDIKNLHLIYHLLRQKKYTIEGAKDFLKKNKKAEERFAVIQRLQQIKAFLLEWKAQL
jgi:DNA-binding transcriptional MerR regulator